MSRRTSRNMVTPSMPGMQMSVTMASNCLPFCSSPRASPALATCIAGIPARLNKRQCTSRTVGSSSMTNTAPGRGSQSSQLTLSIPDGLSLGGRDIAPAYPKDFFTVPFRTEACNSKCVVASNSIDTERGSSRIKSLIWLIRRGYGGKCTIEVRRLRSASDSNRSPKCSLAQGTLGTQRRRDPGNRPTRRPVDREILPV